MGKPRLRNLEVILPDCKAVCIRGGSRNFERGVHKILESRITVFRLWPLFESLVDISLWKFVPQAGVQPCIRLYGDTHRMKQYVLFRLKTKCLKCYTMYNTILISKLLSSMQVTWANFSTENIKWHIFFDFCCCCNANLYSRMADKLSKGSNSSTLKNVSIDNGVTGIQGKAMETQKQTVIMTTKTKQQKTHNQITFEKKSSTLIRLKCIWHLLAF